MSSSTIQLVDNGIGSVTNERIDEALSSSSSGKKKKPQCTYSDEDRYKIAKYAISHGASQAAVYFEKKYPTIRESSVRGFVKKYREQLMAAEEQGRTPDKRISLLKRGRPLMLGNSIDEKVRKYILSLYHKGGHISRATTVITANVLLQESNDLSLKGIVANDSWGKSFLQRIGFRRRAVTTGKVEITKGAKKEMGLQFHYKIVKLAEDHEIPPSLILNADQTPSKYVNVGRTTMAPKNTKHVALAGANDKRSITLTFTETLSGEMLPFQAIYGGKTKLSLPKVTFPRGFSLSVNEKHYSNSEEVRKHLEEIVIPYVESERNRLGKPDQPALLIWDVFRGQMVDLITDILRENNFFYVYVPSNMTHIFQPLDLSTNKWVKDFFKKKFNEWYASRLREELANGKDLDEIQIKFLLTEMKPLHANWMIDCYNQLTSPEWRYIILGGWKESGIQDALSEGTGKFLALMDPFYEIDPFAERSRVDFVADKVSPTSSEFVSESSINDTDSDSDLELL